jgi:hypothetical protein
MDLELHNSVLKHKISRHAGIFGPKGQQFPQGENPTSIVPESEALTPSSSKKLERTMTDNNIKIAPHLETYDK